MSRRFEDCRKTNEDIDDHRDRSGAEDNGHQIVAERYEEPVQTSNDEEDEGNDVECFHG